MPDFIFSSRTLQNSQPSTIPEAKLLVHFSSCIHAWKSLMHPWSLLIILIIVDVVFFYSWRFILMWSLEKKEVNVCVFMYYVEPQTRPVFIIEFKCALLCCSMVLIAYQKDRLKINRNVNQRSKKTKFPFS